jgi:hypothetical protein
MSHVAPNSEIMMDAYSLPPKKTLQSGYKVNKTTLFFYKNILVGIELSVKKAKTFTAIKKDALKVGFESKPPKPKMNKKAIFLVAPFTKEPYGEAGLEQNMVLVKFGGEKKNDGVSYVARYRCYDLVHHLIKLDKAGK